ncbi:exodeoxyribonuclease V subunit gamma [Thermodesulfobacteriota bacterium]
MSPELNVYSSNRLEILAERLARIVKTPLASPLEPEVIVVQSRGMERWVSMEIARHNGICANSIFPFPNTFLQEIFKKMNPELAVSSLFEPGILTFKVMDLLPVCIDRPGFESLKKYLSDDTNDLKLYQVSEKIAEIYDQYLVFRPELIFAWEKGREEHWQAHLWRELSRNNEKNHRAWLQKSLLEEIKRKPNEIGNFFQRVSVFGISYLPLFHLQTIAAISTLVQVNLFLMNPCKEFWADIVSDTEIKRIRKQYAHVVDIPGELHLEKGNRLLASMGVLGRYFYSQIIGFDCELHEQFEESEGKNLLYCIQSDILGLSDRIGGAVSDFDTSIQIHSCHNPIREAEVLHDNLLAMFEEDPDLLPKDILVMMPDIESYAPFISAVFDAQTDVALRIPFSIADQSIRKESRVIDGLMSIFELKESRMGVNRVMGLLESPGIKEKFGLTESDIETVSRWIKASDIRWGIDAESRTSMGLPGFKENTWQAGIERLLLGYAMPGRNEELFSGILPYDDIEGGDVKILGRFLEFFERLVKCLKKLEYTETLNGWTIILNGILDSLFHLDDDMEREIQVLRRFLDDLSEKQVITGFNKKIDFAVIKSHLGHYLERQNLGSGFISGKVTFCAMLPMRSIPAQVICLIGMDNDAFPRNTQPLGFDIMAKKPKMGDRSRRNDDKYLFLEAIVSARKKLYISYVGQSIQDNTQIQPSVLVSELIEYIRDGYALSEDELITQHRLQAFSPAYFKANGKLFSYSMENFLAGSSIDDPKTLTPFISSALSTPPDEWRNLDIDQLCAFLSNPAKFMLEKRLGIYLHETEAVSEERENFNLNALEKYLIGQNLVTKALSGDAFKDVFLSERARGQLPHGNVGAFLCQEMAVDAEMFADKTKSQGKGGRLDSLDVELKIAAFNLFGRLSDIYDHGFLRFRYANTKSKDLLSTWIYHLALCTFKDRKYPKRSLFIGKDAVFEFASVNNPIELLDNIINIYWKGLSEPIHFFPETSYVYAQKALKKKQSHPTALIAAQRRWQGNEFSDGESQNPYFDLLFSKLDPLGEEFKQLSVAVFHPLFLHCAEKKI